MLKEKFDLSLNHEDVKKMIEHKRKLFAEEEVKLNNIRKSLIEELKDYQGEPIKLPYSANLLKKILFRQDINYYDCYYRKGHRSYYLLGGYYHLGDNYLGDNIASAFAKYVYPKIDFSEVDFSDVSISHANISALHNVHINPQTIYRKDAMGTIFGQADFDYNSFDGVNIRNANFEGSKNVMINPQTIDKKDMICTVCDGVDFNNNSFAGVKVSGADFRGSKNALVDCQEVYNHDTTCTAFPQDYLADTIKFNTRKLVK